MVRAPSLVCFAPTPFDLFASLLLLLATASSASAQVTLQRSLNGYNGVSDAKIASSTPSTNKGAETTSSITIDTSNSLLLRFTPIFVSQGGPVPDNASIASATLSLYKSWGPDGTYKANRILKNWTELGVTWNATGTGQSWTTPGVFSGDILSTADGQGTVAAQSTTQGTQCDVNVGWPDICWLNIDVISSVLAFQAGTATNYGWKISYVSGSNNSANKDFYMSEASGSNREVRRPKLTITYSGPPTAALTTIPNPASGNAPYTVQFDASGTTANGSPITNLRLQFGDGTADFNWTDKDNVKPAHSYTIAQAQPYVATLTATNALGTSAPVSANVTVTSQTCPAPTATFNANQQTGTLTVNFDATGSSGGTGHPITTLTWNYGEGQPDPVSGNPPSMTRSHTYATPASYPATRPASLTVTNDCNSSVTFNKTVTLNDPNASTADDCSRNGLTMCIRFDGDGSETVRADPSSPNENSPGHVTVNSLGNTTNPLSLEAQNKLWSATTRDLSTDPTIGTRLMPSSTSRDGTAGMWFRTLEDDRGVKACCQERSELSTDSSSAVSSSGGDQWWAHSLYFPSQNWAHDTPNGNDATGLFQFHGDPSSGQPNWILGIKWQEGNGGSIPGNYVFRSYSAGEGGSADDHSQYFYNTPAGNHIKGACIFANPRTGVWYDFVHHIVWSSGGGARHEIWMREDGGAVKKVLDTNVLSSFHNLWAGSGAYLKFGLYQDLVAGNTEVIHDRIRRGSTPDSVRMTGTLNFPVDLGATVVNCGGPTFP